MKTVYSVMTALAVSGTAVAQEIAPAPASTQIVDALSLSQTVGIYAKNGSASSVAALDSTIAAKAFGLDWHFNVPVYISDASGYGSLELGVSWDFLKSAEFLSSKTTLNVEGGLWMPTGSAGYETTDLNPHIGFGVNMDWTNWNFNQTADCVDQDVVSLVSDIDYKWSKELTVGVNITQEYFDGGGVALLGPSMSWKPATSVDVSAGIGFPVWQELSVENSCVVNAGVSFKF